MCFEIEPSKDNWKSYKTRNAFISMLSSLDLNNTVSKEMHSKYCYEKKNIEKRILLSTDLDRPVVYV